MTFDILQQIQRHRHPMQYYLPLYTSNNSSSCNFYLKFCVKQFNVQSNHILLISLNSSEASALTKYPVEDHNIPFQTKPLKVKVESHSHQEGRWTSKVKWTSLTDHTQWKDKRNIMWQRGGERWDRKRQSNRRMPSCCPYKPFLPSDRSSFIVIQNHPAIESSMRKKCSRIKEKDRLLCGKREKESCLVRLWILWGDL